MSLRDLRSPAERATLDPKGVPPRLRRLAEAKRGVVAVIFAMAFSAILLAGAVVIDYARPHSELVRPQNARDVAGLAAALALGLPDREGQQADAFSKLNTADKAEVVATAKRTMLATLLEGLGLKTVGTGPTKSGRGTVEVA